MRFFDRFKKSERMVPVEVEFTQEELDAIAVDREMILSKFDITNPKAESKDKRPLELLPATFVLFGSPHWTLFATFF